MEEGGIEKGGKDGWRREGGRDEPCSCVICSLLCDLKATAPRVPPPGPPAGFPPVSMATPLCRSGATTSKKETSRVLGSVPVCEAPRAGCALRPVALGSSPRVTPEEEEEAEEGEEGAGVAPRCGHPALGVPSAS